MKSKICNFTSTGAGGFTLIELIVTMAVAGILACIAVPAFSSFVQNDRDVEQVNSLVSSLNYARSEAIKRDSQAGITVCPSVDGATCSGTNWYGGWVVIDSNPADAPLQAIPALNGSNTLSVSGSTTESHSSRAEWSPRARPPS